MRMAVVPVCNEEETIVQTLANLAPLALDEVVLVLNGCTDQSLELCQSYRLGRKRKAVLLFAAPLGVDVPRAVGACYAKEQKASAVLFADSDMTDDISMALEQLLQTLLCQKQDMVLTNCYPYPDYRSPLAKEIIFHREQLNRSLGIFHTVGVATPSHGPHCVSAKALQGLPAWAFAIPPIELAEAAHQKLKIKVGVSLDNDAWHQKSRESGHNERIAQTIIGDCKMAQHYSQMSDTERADFWQGIAQGRVAEKNDLREGYLGAHLSRRFSAIGLNAEQMTVDFQ